MRLLSIRTCLSIIKIHVRAILSKSLTFTILYFFIKREFEKPFSFGILLNKGVCPHSNQAGTPHPLLAFCHLHHLPEKVHFPEPFHLPTLFEDFLDQSVGFKLFKENIIFNG
jgi:hypothetical protein